MAAALGNVHNEVRQVSTHSHPKVAAYVAYQYLKGKEVSTHSHPKVAAPYIKKQ